MKVVKPNVRNMREELSKQGKPKDTDEIRIGYGMGHYVVNITLFPANETQNAHKHYLLQEDTQLVSGSLQAYHDGIWESVIEGQIVSFPIGEYHNQRTQNKDRVVVYPGVTPNIAAVTFTYKTIEPRLNVHQDEYEIVHKYDWFSEKYKEDLTDKSTSPVFRENDEKIVNKFWEIVNRNKQLIRDAHPELVR